MVTRSDVTLERWRRELSPAKLKAAMEEAAMNIEERLMREIRRTQGVPAPVVVPPKKAAPVVPPKGKARRLRERRRSVAELDSDAAGSAISSFVRVPTWTEVVKRRAATRKGSSGEKVGAGRSVTPPAGGSVRGPAKVPC